MTVDRRRVLNKLSYIKEQTTSISNLIAQKSKEEILSDPWVIRGMKYSLQTSIEAIIDLAYHISAKVYSHAPTDARDALRILMENNVISHKDFPTYSAMIGFRNRVVHGYQEVTADRVYEIAKNELSDFSKFIRQVTEILRL